MSRGHKRPKKNLRFSIVLDVLQDAFQKIEDDRDPEKIDYQIRAFTTENKTQQKQQTVMFADTSPSYPQHTK